MQNRIDLREIPRKEIFTLGPSFARNRPDGQKLSFTNYYMEIDGKPFFGVAGEMHYARLWHEYWEDELIKMKMGGVTIVSSYVFWIHHEEIEGVFDFTGRRNLRKFAELCGKHHLYLIIRIGPFSHGEVRNGGIPDWLYGKPCEVRSLDEVFLGYTKRLYQRLAEELSGLFYPDGGPIIAAQVDNEYMHSSAPWEMTAGVSNEWIPAGDSGAEYLLRLRDLAQEAGITAPFYTCTGWGGAPTPAELMPLWGGYAFRPWLFYNRTGDHPATEEYLYRDNHSNAVPETYNFKPFYKPETKPYLCAEMGGGMFCSYNYRFQIDFESVDAMANIKTGGGCNMPGYYMFHGGTNPKGKKTPFLNESQTPKLSYDFQAPLGEFGQIRDSYRRLRAFHLFAETFAEELCAAKTVLPEHSQNIPPEDAETLRFATRVNENGSGFLFVNNYQDHAVNKDKHKQSVSIELPHETITIGPFSLMSRENCILPFNMDIEGIRIKYALAQPLTRIGVDGEQYMFFFAPAGMEPAYHFAEDVEIQETFGAVSKEGGAVYCSPNEMTRFSLPARGKVLHIITLTRRQSFDFQRIIWNGKPIVFLTSAAVLPSGETLRFEHDRHEAEVAVFPSIEFPDSFQKGFSKKDLFSIYTLEQCRIVILPLVSDLGKGRYSVLIPRWDTDEIKDILLQIYYEGNIGHAFIDGDLISDNFWNGGVWEIGLREFAPRLQNQPLTLYITPLKKETAVDVSSAMAGRKEESSGLTACITRIDLAVRYEWRIP
ncbi:MAG: beta-galactosidase [Spirochaetaceae bacterium]|jgi:hypothetical protein|nr:beta-galactosidase [Spirochaetaceae bacterium]